MKHIHRYAGLGAAIAGSILAALALATAPAVGQSIYTLGAGPPTAWLGLSYENVPGRAGTAVIVREVVEDSPAERGGIREGDVLLKLNGLTISPLLMRSISRALQPGDSVRLEIDRDDERRTLTVIAAEPPASFRRGYSVFSLEPDSMRMRMRVALDSAYNMIERVEFPRLEVLRSDSGTTMLFRYHEGGVDTTTIDISHDWPSVDTMRMHVFGLSGFSDFHYSPWGDSSATVWSMSTRRPLETFRVHLDAGMQAVAGAQFVEAGPELGEYFGVDGGLLVTRVAPDTPAGRAGLEPGDVVIEADGRRLADIHALRRLVAEHEGEILEITVVRERERRELRVRLE